MSTDLVRLLSRVPDEHAFRVLAVRCAMLAESPSRRQLAVALRHLDVLSPFVPEALREEVGRIGEALRLRLDATPADPEPAPVVSQLALFETSPPRLTARKFKRRSEPSSALFLHVPPCEGVTSGHRTAV